MFAVSCCDSSLCGNVGDGIIKARKTRAPNREKSSGLLQNLLQRYGSQAVEQARKSVLDESFDDKVVSNALRYFMCDYWKDYATPTLLLLSYEAVGGNSKSLVNVAPALILINGAIDIHDDIIDRSKEKDGRPTVYGKFGEEVALLVGDALLMKGFLMLNLVTRSLDGDKYEKVMNTLKQGLFELGQAEVMELQCRGVADIKAEYYLKVAQKKAADVEALMRLGAILGDAKKSETEALGKYGRIVGFISILRDDIIDMTLQEELRHKLAHECPPLPLIYAIEDDKVRVELLNLIRENVRTERDYVRICNLTKQGYGFQRAKGCADQLVRNGKASIIKLRKRKVELRLILTSLAELKEYETSNPNGI